MGLEGRLRRLEAGPGPARCPECGVAPRGSVRLEPAGDGQGWDGYPEPLLCGGCGRVLRFTLKLGDARPDTVGDGT